MLSSEIHDMLNQDPLQIFTNVLGLWVHRRIFYGYVVNVERRIWKPNILMHLWKSKLIPHIMHSCLLKGCSASSKMILVVEKQEHMAET